MLKAALAGKVLQKGKTPIQYQFSEVKHLHRLSSSLEPLQAAGLTLKQLRHQLLPPSLLLKAPCLGGGVGQQRSVPGSVPWEHHQPLPKPCTPECAGHTWTGLTLLSSHSDPSASSFLRLSNRVPTPAGQSLLLSPCRFFFLIMTSNSLYLKRELLPAPHSFYHGLGGFSGHR